MVQKKSVSKPAAKKTAKSTPATKSTSTPVKKSTAGKKTKKSVVAAKPVAKKVSIAVSAKQKKPAATVKKTAPPKKALAKVPVSKAAPKLAAKPAVKPVAKPQKPSQKLMPAKKPEIMSKSAIDKKSPANGKVSAKRIGAAQEPLDLSDRMAYGMYGGVVVCQDPKPFPKKTPYTDKEIKMLHDILVDERGRLRDLLRSLDEMTLRRPNDEVDSTVPTHLAENATDNQNTETNLLLRRDEEFALRQVEAALERLDGGLFGVCLGCGSKIGIDRLKAKPEAHLCMSCQRVYSEKSNGR